MTQFTIGKVAEVTGVSRQTVRHYEKEGLLPEVDRTASNYRLYGQDEIDRLHFIVSAKNWGLRLDNIRSMLKLQDGSATQPEARAVARENRHEIEAQVEKLKALAKVLEQAENENSGQGAMPRTYPLVEIIR